MMADLSEITDLFKMLSDLTRLRMMRLLVITRRESCVGELMQSVLGQPYNISKQLKVLGHAGLVESRKEGRHVYYRLGSEKEPLAQVMFQLIKDLPDENGEFEADHLRFLEVLEQREMLEASESGTAESIEESSLQKTPDTVAPTPEEDGGDLPSYLL